MTFKVDSMYESTRAQKNRTERLQNARMIEKTKGRGMVGFESCSCLDHLKCFDLYLNNVKCKVGKYHDIFDVLENNFEIEKVSDGSIDCN